MTTTPTGKNKLVRPLGRVEQIVEDSRRELEARKVAARARKSRKFKEGCP